MKELETILCDGREQVRAALAGMDPGFPYTLRSGFSRGVQTGDLVTWGEWSNVQTDCPAADELCFQVTIYAGDPDRLRALCQAVNAAMTGLGLRRVFAGPDGFDEGAGGTVCKTFRFGRKVDKRSMRLVD